MKQSQYNNRINYKIRNFEKRPQTKTGQKKNAIRYTKNSTKDSTSKSTILNSN